MIESRIDFQGSLLIEDSVPENGSFTSNFSETGNMQLESGIDMALEDGVEKDMYISANTTVMRFRGGVQIGSATDIVDFMVLLLLQLILLLLPGQQQPRTL